MGPFTVMAIVGAAVVLAWRAVRRERNRVIDAMRRAESELKKRSPVRLERDPETGVYRPPASRD
jgi:hypothetical protein